MYYILKETTDYGDDIRGGYYLFESKPTTKQANAVGFIPYGRDDCKMFKKPLTIDLRHRTFEHIVPGKYA
jgi:hypothetical protein